MRQLDFCRLSFGPCFFETGAALPGGFGSLHAIRLGIEPFAELGANSSSLSGSEVDPSLSRRAILGLAQVTVLQSLFFRGLQQSALHAG